MSSSPLELARPAPRTAVHGGAALFAAACAAVAAGACLLAGWVPLGFSIITVFLFAGPHNWLEARYLLQRMPPRWGPLRPYFLTGILGVPVLVALSAGVPWLLGAADAGYETWLTWIAVWNTLLLAWLGTLIWLRSRQPPRRDWFWLAPLGLGLLAVNWLFPLAWSIGLVYLHPLIALWFLDRELGRCRPAWRPAYRWCLAGVPLLLGLLWWRLADAPHLPGADLLTLQITRHAGSSVMPGVSSHLLVSTHVFLEMLHYGVWIVAIPLVAVRRLPWQLDTAPLARRSVAWRAALLGVVALGAVLVLVLWAGFLADYPLTRDIYFTVALLHVLAEAPFLLRLL